MLIIEKLIWNKASQNKLKISSDSNIASTVFTHKFTIQYLQPLSPLGSMNREEFFVLQTFFIRRYFVVNGRSCFQQERWKNFSKKFSKTPPKISFPFQTSEGTLIFLFKIPPFFRFPVQTSEGYWKIFRNRAILGVHFSTLCPN